MGQFILKQNSKVYHDERHIWNILRPEPAIIPEKMQPDPYKNIISTWTSRVHTTYNNFLSRDGLVDNFRIPDTVDVNQHD